MRKKADMTKKNEWPEVTVSGRKRGIKTDAAQLVLSILGSEKAAGSGINIVFTDNAAIKRINLEYRGKNYPTDVISFENGSGGDIFISVEKAARQAKEYGASFDEEIRRLVIHGTLHLLGYDHIKDADRKKMEPKERKYFKIEKGTGRN
jgi:rRNA maturation RNase YbeY